MTAFTIQVQSVLYQNQKNSLSLAAENLSNAVLAAQRAGLELKKVRVVYGDASQTPIFHKDSFFSWAEKWKDTLEMEYIFFNENTRHAKGQNLLAQQGNTDYILVLNPDVVVSPHIFKLLVSPFKEPGSKVGITEARQTPFEHPKIYNFKTGETSWATGACALFPRAVFKQVGGFDADSFCMYCDDVDFSWRVRLAGYTIQYVPTAPVFHPKNVTSTGSWVQASSEEYYSAEASLMMAYKWSNSNLTEEILASYSSAQEGSAQHRAANFYLQKKKNGVLPQPIDPNHTVAEFSNQGYGGYRFLYAPEV